jgi:hypothetical protein
MRSKTIQIILKNYDKDSVKIAELSNSMAKVFVIPRNELDWAKTRKELQQPALYMLFDDERTAVYIGECENFNNRVKDHSVKKSFWQSAVICVSNSDSINKADVKFLESYAIQKAIEIGRFNIQNMNSPTSITMREFDKATILDYFSDVELLLTTLGFNLYEPLKDESNAEVATTPQNVAKDERSYDTIVAPCSGDGFKEAFLGKNAWWAVRIGQTSLAKLKYVALYESAPISSIRAYAKIDRIEPYQNNPGKYIIHHDGNIIYFDDPIKLGEYSNLALQGSRYYKLSDMEKSKDMAELTDRAYGTSLSSN